MNPPRRLVELDEPESSNSTTLHFSLPAGYWILLIYFIAVYSLIGVFPAEVDRFIGFYDPPDFFTETLKRTVINFALLVGTPVMLLSIFRIYLFPLTYHRHSFLNAFVGWVISLAVVCALGLGWFALLKSFGFSLLEVEEVRSAMGFFGEARNLYLACFPIAFLAWGFPSEFFRAVLLSGGIRTNNAFVFSLLLLFSSSAFGVGYAGFGFPIALTMSLFGAFLGIYYYLRRSFWELVFLHTFALVFFTFASLAELPVL